MYRKSKHISCWITFFPKFVPFLRQYGNYGTAGHATAENIISRMRFVCRITKARVEAHAYNFSYLLLLRVNNCYANAVRYYVIHSLPALLSTQIMELSKGSTLQMEFKASESAWRRNILIVLRRLLKVLPSALTYVGETTFHKLTTLKRKIHSALDLELQTSVALPVTEELNVE
jgi:hypothetical protein